MNNKQIILMICVLSLLLCLNVIAQESLNIIIIKAHPDEAEEYAGGTAALLVEAGHKVKFLSLTNGDVGHWNMSKKEIAKRRVARRRKRQSVSELPTKF